MNQERRTKGEGALFRRGSDGLWVARLDLGWVAGRRVRITRYARTKTEARKALAEARTALALGDTRTTTQSLHKWLVTWQREVLPSKGLKPRTIANYESYVRCYIEPCLGRVRMDQLGPQHVRQLQKFVRDLGLSETTVGHAHRILGTICGDAKREGVLMHNPVELVHKPAAAPTRRRALSVEELRRFFAVIEGRLDASRWHMAFLLGARPGECLGLEWDRIDFAAGTIDVSWQLQRIPYKHGCSEEPPPRSHCRSNNRPHLCPRKVLATQPEHEYRVVKGNLCLQRPKTAGSTRMLPMIEPMRQSLLGAWGRVVASEHKAPAGLVWPGRSPEADRAEWHQILDEAGIEQTDLYSARHTTASILLALGVPEDVRMAIMGHSIYTTTMQYTHVDLSQQRKAVESLGSRLELC